MVAIIFYFQSSNRRITASRTLVLKSKKEKILVMLKNGFGISWCTRAVYSPQWAHSAAHPSPYIKLSPDTGTTPAPAS